MPELKKRWPLKKDLSKQSYTRLELANGSEIIGIPGSPDKLRSSHPTIVIFDEAAFISEFEQCYSVALAARPNWIIALSSAEVGGFWEAIRAARPCEWPNYEEALALA